MRTGLVVVMLAAVVGCADKKEKTPPPPKFDGPMPVVFGDCAGGDVTWVSGPRPHPPGAPDAAATAPGGMFAVLTGTGDVTSGFDDANIYGGLLGTEIGEASGGFGRDGYGPSGGTGWGTVGTGRYGTIGRGSGYSGVGGGRRGAQVPTVSIGQPAAQGDLDKAIIRRYVKRNIQKLQYCYEKELLAKPGLAGTVATQFFIAPTGVVASSSATGVDAEVSSCVARVIKNIEFPKPKGGGGVQVNYPFTFRPADDTSSAADPLPAAPAPAPVAPAPAPVAKVPARPVDPTQPSGANPLRAASTELAECFRKDPQHFGVAVVELKYDSSGNVTAATPHGIDDVPTTTCVAAIAKGVKRSGATTNVERCSVAFGVMPATALPAVVITESSIAFGGKSMGTPRAVVADDGPKPTIDVLVAAVTAGVEAVTAKQAPVVTLHGPLVVRPIDSTPMKVVDRTLRSILEAGDDPVLATLRGAEWQLVPPMTLPVVPVPVGTGGHWNRIKGQRPAAEPGDSGDVQLSLYMTQQQVWVGLSRVNEFQELPRDSSLADKLATVLADHKRSAFFADRTRLEIAADGDVPYRDLVMMIDGATTAGFSDWVITTPDGLAAKPGY